MYADCGAGELLCAVTTDTIDVMIIKNKKWIIKTE
jgi:hypothetical protein